MDEKMKSENKKGQVGILVIVAIVFFAVIALLVYVYQNQGKPGIVINEDLSPQAYIEKCARDASLEAVELMLPRGGFIEAKKPSIKYNGNEISYLCYTEDMFYDKQNMNGCNKLHPLYMSEIKDEVYNYIKPKIESCFSNLKSELEDKQYDVQMSNEIYLGVELAPERIYIEIEKNMTISKNEESKQYSEFKSTVMSPIHDLGMDARNIAETESVNCNFESLGYMLAQNALGRDISIELIPRSDSNGKTGTKIYVITDNISKKKMYVAIRGCLQYAGLG